LGIDPAAAGAMKWGAFSHPCAKAIETGCCLPPPAAVSMWLAGLRGACGLVAGPLRSDARDLLVVPEMKLLEETS